MNVLLLNFFLYLFWCLYTFYKERRITAYSYLLLFYTFVSFLGFYTVSNGIYFDVFGKKSVTLLQIEPYLLCFATYFILFQPLRKMQFSHRNIAKAYSKEFAVIVKGWVLYFFLFTLLKFSEATASLSLGLGAVYEARHVQGESLFSYNNFFLDKFNGYGFFLLNATVPIIMSYALVGIGYKKISAKYASLLILLCFLPSILDNIAMGTRGGMFMTAFSFLFFVIFFASYLPKTFLSKIYLYSTVFLSVGLFFSWLITSDRVGKGAQGVNSILRYFGESFPNLGFLFWDKVARHPMGERLFPNFFIDNERLLYTSVDDSYQYWMGITGVPVLNFKTYFGDLYIEFGVIGAFVFVGVGFILMKIFFNKKVTIYSLPILYYYFQLCVFAFAGFTKGGHTSFFQLFIVILISLSLKYYLRLKAKGKSRFTSLTSDRDFESISNTNH